MKPQPAIFEEYEIRRVFGKAKGTISEHIKHIFEDRELVENSVVRLFRTTTADGKQRVAQISAAINKAKTACEVTGQASSGHFVDVNKMAVLTRDLFLLDT